RRHNDDSELLLFSHKQPSRLKVVHTSNRECLRKASWFVANISHRQLPTLAIPRCCHRQRRHVDRGWRVKSRNRDWRRESGALEKVPGFKFQVSSSDFPVLISSLGVLTVQLLDFKLKKPET